MALYETLTVIDVLLGAVALILGGLLVHVIAAVIVYGNPGFAGRLTRRVIPVIEPFVQEASGRIVKGMFTTFAEAVEKDPEALSGLIDPFLPKAWEYFIHRFELIKAEMVKKVGDVSPGAAIPGLDMLGQFIPQQFQGIAQQFLPGLLGGGASLPGGSSASIPAPARSGRIFQAGK